MPYFLNPNKPNMKTFYFFIIALFIGNAAISKDLIKQGSINGTVLDEQSKPVDYATVGLFKTSDSSLVKTALTSVNGKFEFININTGNYFVKVNMMGYIIHQGKPFVLTESKITLDLESIHLKTEGKNLKAVTVTALKPLFERRTDKTIMNVESSSIFWFLMKAGYNGVYRINNSGNYNVPFGKKKSIEGNHKNLIIISEQIKDVIFYNEDYSIFLKKLIIENPKKTLFVYADPPYIGNSNGNIYSKNIFDHNELVNTLKKLKETKFAISMEKSLESDKIFKNLEENNLKNVIRKINPNKIIKKDEFLYTNYTIKSNKIRESYEF